MCRACWGIDARVCLPGQGVPRKGEAEDRGSGKATAITLVGSANVVEFGGESTGPAAPGLP